MYSMSSTPLIAFSRGAATVCSSTVAEAPGYTARTCTTGGAISGYCAIGSTRIAAIPASAMKSEMTTAKIGRSMKKRENMMVGYLFFSGDWIPAFAGTAALAPGVPPGDSAARTGAPGKKIFASPSTITLSPAASPR
jgi:hypothetical protein